MDYGYEKGYAGNGIGPVMRNFDVNIDKLSDADKADIQHWLQTQYHSHDALEPALQDPVIKDHITTDMTAAGMTETGFLRALEAYQKGENLPYPLDSNDMKKMTRSMALRNITDPKTYYAETAIAMRSAWPSPSRDHYLQQDPQSDHEKVQVIFFKGFEAAANVTVRAASYAKAPTWPSDENGFDGYDDKGIARTSEGDIIAADKVLPAPHYNYYPHLAISTKLEGTAAKEAIERWLDSSSAPNYNGFNYNCVSGAGLVVFGKKYHTLIESLAGIPSQDAPHVKVTNAMLRQGVLQGNALPDGFDAAQVMIRPETLPATDSQGIGESLRQLERRDFDQRHETALIEKLAGKEPFESHLGKVQEARRQPAPSVER